MAKLMVHSQVFLLWTHQTGSNKSSEIFLLELQNKNRNEWLSQYPNSKLQYMHLNFTQPNPLYITRDSKTEEQALMS